VVIDNFYPSARPASGLSRASIVFETVVEGGITRLLALFAEHDSPEVGPVRSARPYFVKLAAGFRALFVHAGGSPAAQHLLFHTPELADIEALQPGPEFRRAQDRPSPDNLYTSTVGVRAIAVRHGWQSAVPYTPLAHARRSERATRVLVGHIHIDFSTRQVASPSVYAVDYSFDAAQDAYTRSVGGVIDIDRAQNAPVTASNVAVLFTHIALIPGDPLGRVQVAVEGHGRALYFMHGKMLRGTWAKASAASPLRFLSRSGVDIRFVPGSTWIELVPPGGATWSRR
jgi:hypothetical protein